VSLKEIQEAFENHVNRIAPEMSKRLGLTEEQVKKMFTSEIRGDTLVLRMPNTPEAQQFIQQLLNNGMIQDPAANLNPASAESLKDPAAIRPSSPSDRLRNPFQMVPKPYQ